MMLQNRSTTKHIKHKTYKLTLNFELKITEKNTVKIKIKNMSKERKNQNTK